MPSLGLTFPPTNVIQFVLSAISGTKVCTVALWQDPEELRWPPVGQRERLP